MGDISDFTGISLPYEIPEQLAFAVDASELLLEVFTQQVIDALRAAWVFE